MIYESKFRWLDLLAPAPCSGAGVAWRLYWLWPEARSVYFFALATFIFAMVAAGKYFNMPPYLGAYTFAPIELLVFVPIFWVSFLSGAPHGGFGATAGRALAVLPVTQRSLRNSVWFVDVPLAPLVVCATALLAVLPLAFAMPPAYRTWWVVATVLACPVYAAVRTLDALAMAAYLRRPISGPIAWLAEKVDVMIRSATFLAFLVLYLVKDRPIVTMMLVAFSIFAVGWSWLRFPALAAARGESGLRRKMTDKAFSTPVSQYALLLSVPTLVNGGMLVAMVAMFAYVLGPDFWSGFSPSMVLQPAIFAGLSGGAIVGVRIRAMRVLPITTRGLTVAVTSMGALSALPMFLALWLMDSAGHGGLDTVLLALALAACMAAMFTGALWNTFYPLLGIICFLVLMAGFAFIGYALMFRGENSSVMWAASVGLVLALVALIPVAYANYRHFWWDAKIYRHKFPQSNARATAIVVAAQYEELLLGFGLIAAFAGLACGIIWWA